MAKKATKKKTASKKKATKKKAAKPEMLLVLSKAKDALREHDVNIAGDALEGLNSYVAWLVEQAANRAKENGRKTVRAHDFLVM